MDADIRQKEYLMLREEVQTCLKEQRNLSTFSITAVITIIGFTIQMDDTIPGLFLLPYIVLLIAAIKECNYRRTMVTIVAYMISQLETADGFQWESCMNKYRLSIGFYKSPKRASKQDGIKGKNTEKRKSEEKDAPKLGERLSRFMETQEYALMATICFALFLLYSFPQLVANPKRIDIYAGIVVSIGMIVLLIFISRDYWNLDPRRIESQQELWHQILKDKKEKPASSKKKS